MSDLYHVSSSPHVRSKDTTSKIMLYVIMALLPTSLFGIYNFGIRALILILVTIASCVASEWIFNKIVHKKSIFIESADGGSVKNALFHLKIRCFIHGGITDHILRSH